MLTTVFNSDKQQTKLVSLVTVMFTLTWPVSPLCTCVPRGVCVSATARRLGAKGLLIPPLSLPLHTQVRSPDSNNTFHRNMYYYLERGGGKGLMKKKIHSTLRSIMKKVKTSTLQGGAAGARLSLKIVMEYEQKASS